MNPGFNVIHIAKDDDKTKGLCGKTIQPLNKNFKLQRSCTVCSALAIFRQETK